MVRHDLAKQAMGSSAFVVGDNILNQSHNYLIAVNAVQTSAQVVTTYIPGDQVDYLLIAKEVLFEDDGVVVECKQSTENKLKLFY